jgi:L-rhamnose-H+ transport protein
MTPVTPNPLLGVGLHAVGAFFASTCYTPQKGVKRWSWQSYWIIQACLCWLLLPLVGAWLTIPDLRAVLAEAPRESMVLTFLLGAAYGVGGTAFGLAIRHIGFSLTYAVAVGLSSVLGTLIPPLLKGTLASSFSGAGGPWVLGGVVIGTLGIAACGVAGRLKELDLQSEEEKKKFSLAKGLLLSLLAGVLSAVYGFALEAGQPITDAAARHGAGIWQGNVVYIFSNSGAFLTTALYCLHLHLKEHSFGELLALPKGEGAASLVSNYGLAVLTGFLWYGQFFFYNLGHVRMGTYKFTSWAIHMIMLVLLSNVVGLVLREWKGCGPRTRVTLGSALAILVSAVLLLTYGNHLGEALP